MRSYERFFLTSYSRSDEDSTLKKNKTIWTMKLAFIDTSTFACGRVRVRVLGSL